MHRQEIIISTLTYTEPPLLPSSVIISISFTVLLTLFILRTLQLLQLPVDVTVIHHHFSHRLFSQMFLYTHKDAHSLWPTIINKETNQKRERRFFFFSLVRHDARRAGGDNVDFYIRKNLGITLVFSLYFWGNYVIFRIEGSSRNLKKKPPLGPL